ncbi:sensor histidine kinase [Micromonospora sp. CPCC 205711]|uniref:sensor histidine kinase n=1 Tax=Micromonospora sp. CPCC 205547 TaxID=3122400 RepID=UPI002FEFDEE5
MDLVDRRGWPALADVGLGVGLAGGLVFTAAALRVSWGGAYWLPDCALGAAVSLLAVGRRRHRVAAALAGLAVAALAVAVAAVADLPQEPGPVTALALAVLTGSCLRTAPLRAGVAGAVAGAAVVAGSWLSALPARHGLTPVTVLAGAAWLAAVVVGLSLRRRDARGRATVERVRQDERLELARELHDVVAHHITGIVIQAQAAQLVAGRDPQRVAASLAGIEAAGADALTSMRRVVGLLRDTDDAVSSSAGPERLDALVARFQRQGPPVRLDAPGHTAAWPPEVTSTVYRIVREALTNVARHAPQARHVTITVTEQAREITVEVADDAPPSPVRAPHRGGYGLVGMRERVQTLGGTLRAGPGPGKGWTVRATLPVPAGQPR